MKQFTQKIKGLKILNSPWVVVLVALFYLLCTFYYMNPSGVHCTTTVYGFGDNTAGPIWKNSFLPNAPLGGFEKVTNFPVGESTYNPVGITYGLQQVGIWASQKVAGPVCGYNLFNIVGFMSSALIMFGLVYWLTRSRWIALLCGFAASFTPYYQVKIGGHPSYGYQGFFVLILWLYLRLIRYRKLRDAILLAVTATASFYFDPYFLLLTSVLLAAITLAWLGYALYNKQLSKASFAIKTSKVFVIAITSFLVLIAPLFIFYLSHSATIHGYVGSLRGNVFQEAKTCSNYPTDYLAPFFANPIGPKVIGPHYSQLSVGLGEGFPCGIGEDSIGLSITALIIVSGGLLIWAWTKYQRQKNSAENVTPLPFGFVILVLLAVGFIAAWVALPPTKILGVIPTGSYIMLSVTDTWRTIARLYVIVNISLIGLLGMSLLFLKQNIKSRVFKRAGYIVIALLIFGEYQAFPVLHGNTFGTFNYSTDANQAYYWLRDNKDISAIAEYPLERYGQESDIMSYYLTMQRIHRKPMLNSVLPLSPQEIIRSGIKDLTDPQSLAVLSSLGVNTIVIHGVGANTVASITGLEVIYSKDDPINIANRLPSNSAAKDDRMVIARIKGTPKAYSVPLGIQGNIANSTLGRSSADWQYELLQDAKLVKLEDVLLPGNKSDSYNSKRICFQIKMAATNDSDSIGFYDENNRLLRSINATGEYQSVDMETDAKVITLKGHLGHNMRMRNISCAE